MLFCAQFLYIEREDLRDKYCIESIPRLTAMCKAIGKYAQSRITVQTMSKNIFRVEIIGNRIDSAAENVVHELCKVRYFLMVIVIASYHYLVCVLSTEKVSL